MRVYNNHIMPKLTKHQLVLKIPHRTVRILKMVFLTFSIACLMLAIAVSAYIYLYTREYHGRIKPNVYLDDINFGGRTQDEVRDYWITRNQPFLNSSVTLSWHDQIATLSGIQLDIGYDATLSALQAYQIGRSGNIASDLLAVFTRDAVRLNPFFRYRKSVLMETLDQMAQKIDIPPQDALFTFENGRVSAFRISRNGQKLDKEKTIADFESALADRTMLDTTNLFLQLTVGDIEPDVSTNEANSYGIREIIGRGFSQYHGSITGRIHNVALAASRFNGVLIPPGSQLSFNKTLGDVSAATGYQSAYIIKNGRTVLGDGGGVCQVSTTLFRAALDAGLPIRERHAHAYRVHYYEEGGFKPGLDATVFDPTADLVIENNTGHHILIQTKNDPRNLSLTFELYGTGDGRVSSIYNHRVWDVSPPPPDLYQDDPTLKKDTVKQVDWAAWGAKAAFNYRVTRSGETLEDAEFLSVYRPWQAVFLKGTME